LVRLISPASEPHNSATHTGGSPNGDKRGDNRTAITYIARMISRTCRWIAWPLLLAIVFATLSPVGLRPSLAPANIERLVAYVASAGVFGLGYPKHRIKALLLLVAFAGILEAGQHLTSTRHGRISDAAVKMIGAAAGVFLAERLATRYPRLFGPDV